MLESLSTRLKSALGKLNKPGRVTEDDLQQSLNEVRRALLEADVALPVATDFIDKVRERAAGVEVSAGSTSAQEILRVVNEELVRIIGGASRSLELQGKTPFVIMVCGLQGTGKTTTSAKLAHVLQTNQKKKVMLTSIDVYRPAAIDQLATLADSINVDFFRAEEGVSTVDAAKSAVSATRRKLLDGVIIDTAGRLHLDQEMMNELVEVHKAVSPTETLYVLDAMVGQDAVNSAKAFNDDLPLSGVIVTKLDGDARGGALLSVRQITGKPVKYLGVGEGMDALEEFHPDRMASRILGMGDIATLIEQVESKTDKGKAQRMQKKFVSGKRFDLTDYRDQIAMTQDVGGFDKVMQMMPDMPAAKTPDVGVMQQKFKRESALINSMTPMERSNPAIIRSSRRARIARGAGLEVRDVSQLLRSFEKMNKMSKKLLRQGKKNPQNDMNFGDMPFQ